MTSIRFYLVAAIIACITLINFMTALHGYRSSMFSAQQLFDRQLIDMTQMLATVRQNKINLNLPKIDSYGDYIAFQLWQDDRVLIARSDNAPMDPIAPFESGFRDRNFGGYRWRIYVHHEPVLKEWMIIAERSDTRSVLAEKVILESVLPTVLALPVVALMIWFIVGFGLKPLRKLTKLLRNKEANDLAPLAMDAPPVELKSLVESANGLLHRLEASFLREKRFAGDAAHELRTPISVLKVHLYNLQAEWPAQESILLQLKEGVDRMDRLVEQILALYRTAPDQYMVKFEDNELFDLTRKMIASVYHQFDEKQQRIKLLGGATHLKCDQFAMETLLHNLLNNACKYSPPGSRIIVTVKVTANGAMLAVEDSGPGIPKDKYQRVFERFYRVHGDRHDSGTLGCGLGLAIVKHIVELHGATIKLGPSRFESGLCVTVLFSGTMVIANKLLLNTPTSESLI